MTKPLPKWVMLKYAELWKKFSEGHFEHSQTIEILDENASVIINHLKKNGWIEVALHPKDSRKRIYRLKSPEKVIQDMANEKD